jgi:hypothetical protein
MLLRNMLFVGLVAMPAGGLAGALLGFALGFLSALFGAGIGCIVTFPMTGLCFGQAFGVGLGFLLVAILGDSFVAPFRRKALTFARFVFDQNAAPSASDDPGASR